MKLRNKKTGNIYTLSENLYIEYTQGGKIEVRAIIPGGNMSYYYDSLDKLNEDWEDVKEPLIEDEKIHKIVRDWAECCGFSSLKHYLSEGLSCFICTDEEGNDYCLDFTSRIDNLESGKIYNIKEL